MYYKIFSIISDTCFDCLFKLGDSLTAHTQHYRHRRAVRAL